MNEMTEMNERVTVKVKAGQSLTTPEGRLIQAGETVAVPREEAAFFERMGAAEIVAAEATAEAAAAEAAADATAAEAADPKPAKKAKNGPQSQ